MKKVIDFVFKKVKLRSLLILILLLVFNVYAWFTYNSKVKLSITSSVEAWQVEFKASDEEITASAIFDFESIYPGIVVEPQFIEASNKGDVDAKLTYRVVSVTILGEKTSVGDLIEDDILPQSQWEEITSNDLEDMLLNDYPFVITITVTNSNLDAGSGVKGRLEVSIEWDFESEIDDNGVKDEWDTQWGEKAYDYYKNNPKEKSIIIELEVVAKQVVP